MPKSEVVLKSVEVAGFKSFAKRTKIDFGSDFCAIVGPNGSGKSNIADAVRWVLGEQKNKLLRTQRSEEVIFHGGEGKARASMAEVTISLNNQNGAIPVEFSEIEITRRLYRSGESNYLLNGKKVTKSYLQELFSKGKFAVGSYTVIGQGTIDRLVMSSGLERKLLFEEASGIKQYEIKLSQTKSKLAETTRNLSEITGLLNQLAPEYKNLDKQYKILQKRDNIQHELEQARQNYVGYEKNRIGNKIKLIQAELSHNLKRQKELQTKLSILEKNQAKLQNNKASQFDAADKIRKQLEKSEKYRDKLIENISTQNALLNTLLPKKVETDESIIKLIKVQITQHNKSLESIIQKATKQQKFIEKLESQISNLDKKVSEKTEELNSVREQLSGSQKKEYLTHALGLLNLLQKTLEKPGSESQAKVIFYKLYRMIQHSLKDNAAELALNIGRIQNITTHYLAEREQIVESQTTEIIKLRSLEMDQASIEAAVENLKTQQADIKNNHSNKDIKKIAKIKKIVTNLESQKQQLDKKVNDLRDAITKGQKEDISMELQNFSKQHENLATEIVLLKQQANNANNQVNNLSLELDNISELQQKWSVINMPNQASLRSADLQLISRLEAELLILEEVDPNVQEDLTQTKQKVDFLNRQKHDLSSAIDNLNKVINDIESKLRVTFQQNFSVINNKFNDYYQKLFGGGWAKLILQSENDTEWGIEIAVQLPQKKTQSLNSFSGGEKALASVALLCGILSANPSPFVVLDEVDAALDELNTIKFAKILQEITNKSQILVITHNHDTMAAANELVGVTTTLKGDSQILHVKLTQADELVNSPT